MNEKVHCILGLENWLSEKKFRRSMFRKKHFAFSVLAEQQRQWKHYGMPITNATHIGLICTDSYGNFESLLDAKRQGFDTYQDVYGVQIS